MDDESSTLPDRPGSSGAAGARRRGGRPGRPQKPKSPPRARNGRRAPAASLPDESVEGKQGNGDRQFISALARGLEVLSAFRAKDGPLGNQELSQRTGIPPPTVSRITYTLTQLGFLSFNKRLENYELGGSALSLSFVAMASLEFRAMARPLIQELARGGNFNVGLARRDKLMMLMVETVESESLIALRLPVGSRMPIATTALGRAYLAALSESDREAILEELRPQFGADWPTVRRGIEKAIRDIERQGFCTSVGEWQKDINGAGAAILLPDGGEPYAIDAGGPAYLVTEAEIHEHLGPRLAQTARDVSALLTPRRVHAT